jgi:hypothetical protein
MPSRDCARYHDPFKSLGTSPRSRHDWLDMRRGLVMSPMSPGVAPRPRERASLLDAKAVWFEVDADASAPPDQHGPLR